MEAIHVYFSQKIQQVIGFSNIMHVKTAFSIQQAIHFLKDYDNNIIMLINHFCVLHILLVSKYRGLPPSSILFLWVEGAPATFSLPFCYLSNTGIKNFSFLCWMLCIVGQKVSSSSCILLRKCWNLLPNNDSIHIEVTKIWLQFKTWCSLSVPRCAAYLKGN